MSDAEFVAVVEKVAGVLFKQFGRVHGDLDDFRQQVALWALSALPKYDPARGTLGAFVHRHARFRAMNALRDQITRDDPLCKSCHAGVPCDRAGDRQQCPGYAKWLRRNQAKSNIARPLSMGDHPDRGEGLACYTPNVEGGVLDADLMRFIDERLPTVVRGDYLRLMAGEAVTSCRKAAVRRAVAAILSEAGLPMPGEAFSDEDVERCQPSAGGDFPCWAELSPGDGDDEQEGDGDDQPPLGAEPVPSITIPESSSVA
ncbi:hypothetical protein J0H58_02620 [bacterium]|nr:hypothetical protein [bacterium]